MKLYKILALVVIIGQHTLAETTLPVDWSGSSQISVSERAQLLNQARTAIQAAGYCIQSNTYVKAEYINERDLEPFQECFFTFQSPKGKLWVHCLYPLKKWLKYYLDWEAVSVAQKYGEDFAASLANARKKNPAAQYPELLDMRAKHPRKEAEERARLLAKTVGGVDLTEWHCVSWSFDRGQWTLSFHPYFQGHQMKIASVTVSLSDMEGLKLCKYHNTMLAPLPQYESVPNVISQDKARKLADNYVKTYYKRQTVEQFEAPELFQTRHQKEKTAKYQSVAELTFATNVLEVVRPNYYFTDKYDKDGKWLTNAPRWSWTAHYTKVFSTNYFTFSKTPVWIYVDAITGEMLGGSE